MKENNNLKIHFIVLIIILTLIVTFAFYKMNLGNSRLLIEHCNMLPGADGCEKYVGKYKETGKLFSRNVENLELSQEPSVYSVGANQLIQLSIDPVKTNIQGKEIRTYGYNGQIPGTLLKVKQGDVIFVNVTNNLEQDTTVHWHGIRLKNEFDGIPHTTQDPIQPSKSFIYELTFPDAGIYWYHPHEREDYQQELGLYGNILVEPSNESYYNKVNREEFLFLDDIQITEGDVTPTYENKISQVLMGRFGNVMLVNGRESYNITINKGDMVRFYLTNVANTRLFNFSIESTKLKLVGSDGGIYEREFYSDSLIIAPSERATIEALFDKPGIYKILHANPVSTYVLGYITVLNQKTSEDLSNTFSKLRENNLIGNDLGEYRDFINQEPNVSLKLDIDFPGMNALGQNIKMNHADETGLEWEDGIMHNTNLASSNNTVHWLITDAKTGKSNMDIMYNWKVGDKIKIRIINDEDSAHPMQHPIHLHGQRFLVLATDGVPNDNLVWKDTVLVPTGKSVDILVDMTNPGKWMTHCHIAEHLSDGMMFEFEVEG